MKCSLRHPGKADRGPSRSTSRRKRGTWAKAGRAETTPLLSNMAESPPVTPKEVDLMRIYFADLIASALKGQ